MSIRLSSHMKKWMACHQWLKLGQIFREYGNRSKNQIKDLEQMFGKSTVLMWKMFPYARHNTWHIDLVTNCVSSNCRLRTLKCTLYHTSASYIYIYKYVSDYSTHVLLIFNFPSCTTWSWQGYQTPPAYTLFNNDSLNLIHLNTRNLMLFFLPFPNPPLKSSNFFNSHGPCDLLISLTALGTIQRCN